MGEHGSHEVDPATLPGGVHHLGHRRLYREAFVLVEAEFAGQPVNDCPYIFLDNDAALARGWAQGYPK
ncbi:hypothetical protein JOE48_005479 [Methylobacterium sp. PvR107]|nr:acetoacetate decarboxylase family protein [Methylobacterium sp. PvR107]MBP1183515.1 hypothetical protein [Methylobacterium sp. PvR107]